MSSDVEFLPGRLAIVDGVVVPLPDPALVKWVTREYEAGSRRGALGIAVGVEDGRIVPKAVSASVLRVSAEGPSYSMTCSFDRLPAALAIQGVQIPLDVSPQYEALGAARPPFFEAVAWYRPLSAEIPEALVFLWDYRGCAAFIFADEPTVGASGRTLGDDLAATVFGTRVAEEAARRDAALRMLGAESGRGLDRKRLSAGPFAEYLCSDRPQCDGGLPVTGFLVVFEGSNGITVRIPDAARGADPLSDRRRARLGNAVRGALVDDAFGEGIQSPRSVREIQSLDAIGDYADDSDPAALLQALDRQREAADRLASLSEQLRDDERVLLECRRHDPDRSLRDIAHDHGWDGGDVETTWRRIKRAAKRLELAIN